MCVCVCVCVCVCMLACVRACLCVRVWLDLQKPATYAHNGKNLFHHQSMAASICQLITATPLPKVDWSTFFEACFWGLSDVHECSGVHWCHWSACIGSHLDENNHMTYSWCRPWIYLYFVTFWVQWGLILDYFTSKIVKLHCSPPLYGYSPPLPPPSTPI